MRPFIPLVLVVLLGVALGWALWTLPERVEALRSEAAADSSALLEDAELFARARAAGLIDETADGRLRVAPADLALTRRVQAKAARNGPRSASEAALDPVPEDLLERLYQTPAGAEVRSQIDLWNRSRVIAAVRDNAVSLGASIQTPWHAEDCRGGGRDMRTGGVPVDFGYVHQHQLAHGFGPWHSASVPDGDCLVFEADFAAAQRPTAPLLIQFVGKADKPNEIYCSPKIGKKADKKTDPLCGAGEWQVAASQWKCASASRDCRLRVVRNLMATPYEAEVVGGVKLRRSPKGAIQWVDLSAPIARHHQREVQVQTHDGIALLDDRGRATAKARELGLLGLVGLGPADFSALSGILIQGDEPLNLQLTLDSRFNTNAQDALETRLKDMGLLSDAYADERRAALVVMDAKDGSVKAAATWPPAPQDADLQAWDRAAFSKVYPLRDPFKNSAWQMVDRHNAPGSTFKPVNALSALRAVAKGHPDAAAIEELILGLTPNEFQQRTGVSSSASSYNPYRGTGLVGRRGIPSKTIANYGQGRLSAILGRAERDASCGVSPPTTKTIGLTPAARDSVNVWFDVLAMAVDGQAALAFDRDSRSDPPQLWLMQQIDALGLRDALDLLPGRPQDTATLRATPGNASLFVDRPYPMAWTLVQNAIGQGVQITPLHLAGVAASIATNQYIRPHLDAAWNQVPVALQFDPLGVNLDPLRAGMKAVPEVGTARGAFAGLPERCRFYGKTGTATVGSVSGGNESYNSAWFMGWLEDEQGAPKWSFACMVSHSPRTGGATCAPVVTGFLKRMAELEQGSE